jgi:hypothetical protein
MEMILQNVALLGHFYIAKFSKPHLHHSYLIHKLLKATGLSNWQSLPSGCPLGRYTQVCGLCKLFFIT